jgi:hypothetical protein
MAVAGSYTQNTPNVKSKISNSYVIGRVPQQFKIQNYPFKNGQPILDLRFWIDSPLKAGSLRILEKAIEKLVPPSHSGACTEIS